MFDLVKKSLLVSLGAAIVTKDRIDEATKNLVDRGKISKDEAEKLAVELLKSGEKQWEELQAHLRDLLAKIMETFDIPKNSDTEGLKARMDELEKRLAVMEAASDPRMRQS